jgi:hypothetical protein
VEAADAHNVLRVFSGLFALPASVDARPREIDGQMISGNTISSEAVESGFVGRQ